MDRYKILYGLCLLVLLGIIGYQYRLAHERELRIQSLESELTQANTKRAEAVRGEIEARRQLADVNSAVTERKMPGNDEKAYEDELDQWFGKVRRLSAFLKADPTKGLPEMRLLTASDWLDATKDAKLETEADYRKALAKLRGLARRAVAPDISKAVKDAVAQNGGNLPADVQSIQSYLPAGFDPEILKNFTVNTSGQVKWVVTDEKVILVEKPVDPLWDQTTFYTDSGTWGTHSLNPDREKIVLGAINAYTQNTGSAPTSASQLSQYLNGEMKPALLEAVYKAVTTKPNM